MLIFCLSSFLRIFKIQLYLESYSWLPQISYILARTDS